MLVFRISEERTTDKVLKFKVVNKFFIPLKGSYYTTLPYIIKEFDEELEYDFEKLRLKIISLLKEYYNLNLRETITEVRFIPDKNRQTPGCDDYYTLLALGFSPEEAGKLLGIKDYKHIYNLMLEQLADIVKSSFLFPEKPEGKHLEHKLRTSPNSFTVPELIKVSYNLLNPKIRKNLYGIKKLRVTQTYNKRETLYTGITEWLFSNDCVKGLRHTWIISPYSGRYKVHYIGDFFIIKRVSPTGIEETLDTMGVIREATVEDSKELIHCLPKVTYIDEMIFQVSVDKYSGNSEEYHRVSTREGNIKTVTKCTLHIDKNSETLYAIIKKDDGVRLVKFKLKHINFDYYVILPGFGEVKLKTVTTV